MKPGQTTLPGARSITSQPAGGSPAPIEAMTGPSVRTPAGTVVAPIPSATSPPRSSIGVDSGRSPPVCLPGPPRSQNLPGARHKWRPWNVLWATTHGREERPMTEQGWLAEQFEQNRQHLQAVAYGMLGSIGLALLVVLESLSPAERLAFVLHDVFAVPFEEIARVVDRSPDSARQLASRARRRVQAAPQPDRDVALQRRVVDAFLAAARAGDFEALVEVLDPGVVFRADLGPGSPGRPPLAGSGAVAGQ